MNELTKIYVKYEFRKPTDTLYTFLKRILSLDNSNLWTKGSLKSSTYFDPQYTLLQCLSSTLR